jgi:hypothetical protein
MVNAKSFATKSIAVVSAVALTVAAVVPLLTSSAGAAQVTSRSIQMGKSQASATDTQYVVKFTTPSGSSSNIGGVVVQFCANSPIVGIDCSSNAPAGFDLNETNLNVNGVVGLSGFTMNAATDANTFIFTNATPQSVGASTAITINLGDADQTETSPADGVTNPSGAGTFYARIITFDTEANATNAAVSGDQSGVYTGAQDYAGVALSVNPDINVTALVTSPAASTTPAKACCWCMAPSAARWRRRSWSACRRWPRTSPSSTRPTRSCPRKTARATPCCWPCAAGSSRRLRRCGVEMPSKQLLCIRAKAGDPIEARNRTEGRPDPGPLFGIVHTLAWQQAPKE